MHCLAVLGGFLLEFDAKQPRKQSLLRVACLVECTEATYSCSQCKTVVKQLLGYCTRNWWHLADALVGGYESAGRCHPTLCDPGCASVAGTGACCMSTARHDGQLNTQVGPCTDVLPHSLSDGPVLSERMQHGCSIRIFPPNVCPLVDLQRHQHMVHANTV